MPSAATLRTPPLPNTMAKRGGAACAGAGALAWTVSKFMGSLGVGVVVNATVRGRAWSWTKVHAYRPPRGA